MDKVLVLLYVVTLLTIIRVAFQRGDDDANWDLRWHSLEAADRARLAATPLKRDAQAELSPEELELLKGYRRHQSRRRAYDELAVSPILIVLAALTLTGLIGPGIFAMVSGLLTLAASRWGKFRDRQTAGRLRAEIETEGAAATSLRMPWISP